MLGSSMSRKGELSKFPVEPRRKGEKRATTIQTAADGSEALRKAVRARWARKLKAASS